MRQKILSLLKENARISLADICKRTGLTESEAAAEIKALEKSGVIRGYTAGNRSRPSSKSKSRPGARAASIRWPAGSPNTPK